MRNHRTPPLHAVDRYAASRHWHAILAACLIGLVAGCGKHPVNKDVQTGTGPRASLSVSDGPVYDFGVKPMASVTSKRFSVTNTGKAEATQMTGTFYFSMNFSYKGGSYPGEGGDCGDRLGMTETCSVVVTFAPAYAGTFEEILRVSYLDGAEIQTTATPVLRGRSE